MAKKIIDFLDGLGDKKYTDEKLRKDATDFGLSETQTNTVASHDLDAIKAAIDTESGNPKGRVVRVVM